MRTMLRYGSECEGLAKCNRDFLVQDDRMRSQGLQVHLTGRQMKNLGLNLGLRCKCTSLRAITQVFIGQGMVWGG